MFPRPRQKGRWVTSERSEGCTSACFRVSAARRIIPAARAHTGRATRNVYRLLLEQSDEIIRTEAQHARLVAGFVAWQPGELADEIERGAWFVLSPEPSVVLRQPQGLWEELVRRSAQAANAI